MRIHPQSGILLTLFPCACVNFPDVEISVATNSRGNDPDARGGVKEKMDSRKDQLA